MQQSHKLTIILCTNKKWLPALLYSMVSHWQINYIICINYQHDSCVHVIYIYIINSVSQRGPEVQTETVKEDEELEDVDALDDIFADDKDFCEGYLNEIQLV